MTWSADASVPMTRAGRNPARATPAGKGERVWVSNFAYNLFFDRDAVDELYLIRQKLEENFLPSALANLSPQTVPELHRLRVARISTFWKRKGSLRPTSPRKQDAET
jgi:hypothetical protein